MRWTLIHRGLPWQCKRHRQKSTVCFGLYSTCDLLFAYSMHQLIVLETFLRTPLFCSRSHESVVCGTAVATLRGAEDISYSFYWLNVIVLRLSTFLQATDLLPLTLPRSRHSLLLLSLLYAPTPWFTAHYFLSGAEMLSVMQCPCTHSSCSVL